MPTWLTIQRHSGVRIDLQIVEQIKHALEVGILQPGEQLPNVRDLASELTLAPNTIVNAYRELQRQGLIESRPRVGTIVVANINGTLRQQQIAALLERLDGLVRDAAALGIDLPQLTDRFEAATTQFYGSTESEETG